MQTIRTLLAGGLTLCAAVATPLAAQDFKVVVNSANPATEITAAALSKIFLKESTSFPGAGAATPVDQGKASPVRATFSKRVIGRPVGAVETYWQQQIFSGKDVPPPSKASDDDVLAFVKATPGGVGYVSTGASVAGVKVIELK